MRHSVMDPCFNCQSDDHADGDCPMPMTPKSLELARLRESNARLLEALRNVPDPFGYEGRRFFTEWKSRLLEDLAAAEGEK